MMTVSGAGIALLVSLVLCGLSHVLVNKVHKPTAEVIGSILWSFSSMSVVMSLVLISNIYRGIM